MDEFLVDFEPFGFEVADEVGEEKGEGEGGEVVG